MFHVKHLALVPAVSEKKVSNHSNALGQTCGSEAVVRLISTT